MSRLTVNANSLENEGLDTETVNLGTSNLEVGIGGGGADGVGIASIEQTTTSTEDGGINEVTQTLTDGTTAVFQIRNGSRGSQGLQGERGLQGIQGEKGEKGDAGEDWIPTQAELASIAQSAAALVDVPTKTSDLQNDSGFITISDVPEGSTASSTTPKMDGTASVGSETAFARGDHRHPSDTSKQDTISDLAAIRSGAALGATALQAETDPVFTASAAHGISSSDISSWNAKGTYSKPSGGIPKTDLASAVQTSLGKADTALQSFTETDPTVPSWAKQSTKPTYTASEVGALPASTTIPSALADLSADSTHRVVTDTEKATWNAKGTYSKPSGGIPASDLASGVIPTVPTTVSSFTNDSHYVASTAITNIVSLTQAAYDALATKDANTLYIIPES